MYHVEIILPLVSAIKDGRGDQAWLERGDKSAEITTSIISRAFATKAKCHRWAYRHGGIEEHDAQLKARELSSEYHYFQEHGEFRLRQTKDFPAGTLLNLIDTGTRQLPDEAQKKSDALSLLSGSWRWYETAQNAANAVPLTYAHADICQCSRCQQQREARAQALREAAPGITPEQIETLTRPVESASELTRRARQRAEVERLRAQGWQLNQDFIDAIIPDDTPF